MKTRLFRHYGPQKEKFSQGIQALQILKTGDVLVGAGDGTVALLKSRTYKRIRYRTEGGGSLVMIDHVKYLHYHRVLQFFLCCRTAKVDGGVTSLTLRGAGHQV